MKKLFLPLMTVLLFAPAFLSGADKKAAIVTKDVAGVEFDKGNTRSECVANCRNYHRELGWAQGKGNALCLTVCNEVHPQAATTHATYDGDYYSDGRGYYRDGRYYRHGRGYYGDGRYYRHGRGYYDDGRYYGHRSVGQDIGQTIGNILS